MNKKVVNITSLVAGILSAVVALFYAIQFIIALTWFNGDASAKSNSYVAVLAVLYVGIAVALGFFSYFIIKKYINNKDEESKERMPALCYFCYEAIINLVVMCFWGFNMASKWVVLVFAVAGLVLILLTLFKKFDSKTDKILVLVATVIGFVLSIVNLTNAGGISIAIDIFLMFMFVAYFLYYLFSMIVNGDIKAEETKEEKTETK